MPHEGKFGLDRSAYCGIFLIAPGFLLVTQESSWQYYLHPWLETGSEGGLNSDSRAHAPPTAGWSSEFKRRVFLWRIQVCAIPPGNKWGLDTREGEVILILSFTFSYLGKNLTDYWQNLNWHFKVYTLLSLRWFLLNRYKIHLYIITNTINFFCKKKFLDL